MRTTRRTFLGLIAAIAAIAPAAAALSVAPRPVEATEPTCAACDALFRYPVPIPDVFKPVSRERTEMVIAAVHATAEPDIVSHRQVAAPLWAQAFTYTGRMGVDSIDLRELSNATITGTSGTFSGAISGINTTGNLAATTGGIDLRGLSNVTITGNTDGELVVTSHDGSRRSVIGA